MADRAATSPATPLSIVQLFASAREPACGLRAHQPLQHADAPARLDVRRHLVEQGEDGGQRPLVGGALGVGEVVGAFDVAPFLGDP
jgi:hypothetical protein